MTPYGEPPDPLADQELEAREMEESTVALVPTIVRPIVSAEEALEAWQQYQGLKEKIAGEGDFVKISGKAHPTKQFANKLSKFFGLSVSIIERWKEEHEDGSFTWHIITQAKAPNGQFREGDGHCHSQERDFSHLQHDVFATAVTRAKNRAILELAGFGEVSAEEMQSETTSAPKRTQHWIEREDVRKRFWLWAKDVMALAEDEVHEALGVGSIKEFPGTMKEAKAKIEAWVDEQIDESAD